MYSVYNPPQNKNRNTDGKETKDILNSSPLELIYSDEDPATYFHYNGTRTTSDLLLVSSDISEFTQRKIIDDPGYGHKPVIASIIINSKSMTPKMPTGILWKFKKADWPKFTNLLETELNARKNPKKEPIRSSNKLLTTESEIANSFARFYSNKQEKNPFVENSSRDIRKQVTKFDEIKEDTAIPHEVLTEPFSSHQLNAAIKQLKCKKSPGEDCIHPEFLIRIWPKAKEILLTLFNKTWETSLVPTQWKVAIVISILKKGKDPNKFDSHRPISLTSMLAKLMERMVNTRLTWFLETINILGN
nr:pol protein [Hymenolepis microstoma]